MIALEILVCLLATVGVYALFVRLAVHLKGTDGLAVAVIGTGKGIEEILLEIELLRLRGEIDPICKKAVVLLEKEDAEKENALRSEGILVYILGKGG